MIAPELMPGAPCPKCRNLRPPDNPASCTFCSEPLAPGDAPAPTQPPPAEFCCVWFECSECWRVLLPDGTVLGGAEGFGSEGEARGAFHDHTHTGEVNYVREQDTGYFYRWVWDHEYGQRELTQ